MARLSESAPEQVDVTVVDQSDAFVFGFSKLDVMFGRSTLPRVRAPYAEMRKAAVTFRQERVLAIDPVARRVVPIGAATALMSWLCTACRS